MRTDDDFLLLTEELPAPLRLRTSRRRLLSGEVERWHPPHQVSDVQLTHPAGARRQLHDIDGRPRPHHRSTSANRTRDPNDGALALTPLTSGPIEPTRAGRPPVAGPFGSSGVTASRSRPTSRPGRSRGKRGAFAWCARIAWVDLGSGHSVGTGIGRSCTGRYAHLEGHGRIALVADGRGPGAGRAEGLSWNSAVEPRLSRISAPPQSVGRSSERKGGAMEEALLQTTWRSLCQPCCASGGPL
jgi:hypothetical protein